jgi:adenine/guanine phosphoribosyltransferase-like PRPP-binding protein
MRDPYVLAASYLHQAILDPQTIVNAAKDYLIPNFRLLESRSQTTLVGTGLSGTIGTALLAYEFGFRYAVLRKGGESCHSWVAEAVKREDVHFEGVFVDGGQWVFVDDCIDSGTTARRVSEAVEKLAQPGHGRGGTIHLTYAGSFLYNPTPRWIDPSVDIRQGLGCF